VSRWQVLKPAAAIGRSADSLFLALVLLFGAGLLFCRLDDAYLWQDEAETALVAGHLLTFGLPLSSDGITWVQQAGDSFVEFTADYVWTYHSWLQYVVVAASFAVLGATTFAARLPFVLAGLATLVMTYRIVVQWLSDTRAARLATVLLLFCVPFLLSVRQCRYYALATLTLLLTLDAYRWMQSPKPWGLPYFVLSATLLYHSHYGAFFPTMAALGLHWLCSRREAGASRRMRSAAALVAALVLPWAAFMRVTSRGQAFRPDRFLAHIGQYAVYTTGWIFPLAMLILLSVAWIRRGTREGLALSRSQASFCQLAAVVAIAHFAILSFSAAFDWVFFRYMVHLIPLLLCTLAIVIVLISERAPVLAFTLVSVIVVSNALGMFPYGLPGIGSVDVAGLWPGSGGFEAMQDVWIKAGRFRSDLWMYAQELSHSYMGPNEGLVAYLGAKAQPAQTVAVNYEDLPLMFYSDLRVVGGLGLHDLHAQSRPDWLIDRKHGPYRDLLADIVAEGRYERIELPYPDIRWENRPEPGVHHYLTVKDAEPVVLYRRLED